jgi:hypothetical protein
MYEFAAHMKTLIRYSLIILTLGLFSSCAEQFREIRGSQNQGNAFFGGGLTSSTAAKRTDKAKGETVMPQQTVINVEQTVTEPIAENTPDANLLESKIEKAETNQAHTIQGQKSSISGKGKKGQFHFLKKPKLSNPVKILKKSLSQRASGSEINGFLLALGILGLIVSILGLLIFGFAALWGASSLIMEILGFWSSYPILIDILVFLLGLISSIGLLVNPRFEDSNPLKIVMVILATLPIIVLFMFILLL